MSIYLVHTFRLWEHSAPHCHMPMRSIWIWNNQSRAVELVELTDPEKSEDNYLPATLWHEHCQSCLCKKNHGRVGAIGQYTTTERRAATGNINHTFDSNHCNSWITTDVVVNYHWEYANSAPVPLAFGNSEQETFGRLLRLGWTSRCRRYAKHFHSTDVDKSSSRKIDDRTTCLSRICVWW